MYKALILGFAIGLLVCDSGGSTPGGAGSAAPASGKGNTTLTRAQLDEAYKLTDPDKYDASVAAATGKLGKPTSPKPIPSAGSRWTAPTATGCCSPRPRATRSAPPPPRAAASSSARGGAPST